jgi:DnaJ-class molecular chaperone
MKVNVKTDIFEDGKIIQEVFTEEVPNIMNSLIRTVIDTKEIQVRQALIKLGWTPPPRRNKCTVCNGRGFGFSKKLEKYTCDVCHGIGFLA